MKDFVEGLKMAVALGYVTKKEAAEFVKNFAKSNSK